ncbi:MAG TPA: LPS export ABC transporter permease LptF [Syntrophales bacterium]|nr:LPS export ABC transporter permease LptF [Syntrophales bacterium]HRT27044.1 LPS export ABC transporter permease LptF [Syntrophales bacterium]
MRKILNRYILKEITLPFLMTLLVFTFVLLIGKILQIMDLMVNKGVNILAVVKIVLFILPSFLTVTIPISLLIAVLIGLGRLSSDNEITAMKASGISLYQLLLPIVTLCVVAMVATAVIGFLAPLSNSATKSLFFDILKEKASIGIKEKVFNDDFKGLVLYADRIPVEGNYMEGVMVFDNRLTKEPATIIAPQGYLSSNPESMTVTLRLLRGSIHSVDSDLKTYKKTEFSTYDVNLDLQTALAEAKKASVKGSADMTVGELYRNIRKAEVKDDKLRDMVIELNKKFAVPLSCLVFGIAAIPLGIVSRRSGKSRGFTVGLFVVAAYYTLLLAGEAFGETGKIPPTVAVWSPNIIMGTLGIYLFVMAANEKPLPFSSPSDFTKNLYERLKGKK